jgi:hypothetical protein
MVLSPIRKRGYSVLHLIQKWLGRFATPASVVSPNVSLKPKEDPKMYPKTKAGLKQELKELAGEIKEGKAQLRTTASKLAKGEPVDGVPPVWLMIRNVANNRRSYRHKHIVYSLLRGKTREQIEKPNPYNKPSERSIEAILKEYLPNEEPEAVCTCPS